MDNNFDNELKKAEAEQLNATAPAESAETVPVQPNVEAPQVQPAQEMSQEQPMTPMQPAPEMPQGQPAGGKSKKEKKPLSKGAVAGIVGGGIALVAAVVCGILFIPKLLRSDKEVVMDAAKETFAFSESTNYIEELVDSKTINETYYSEGGSVSYNLSLDSVIGEEIFSGMQLSVDSNFDPVNELANTVTSLDYNDVNILTLSDAVDSENMYLMLSNFADVYLSLPTDNTLVALQDSSLGQAMDMYGMPEFNIDYFGTATGESSYLMFADDAENIWDSATFEKQKGKVKITVNGEDITAKEYFVTITEEDMKASLELILNDIVEMVASDPAVLESAGIDEATFNMYAGLVVDELVSMISEDLVIKVYISGDKIVKVTNSYTLSYGGVDLTGDLYIDIDDEDMSGALKFYVMDQEVGVVVDVKDVYGNPNGSVTAYYNDEEVVCDFESIIEDTDSTYKLDLTGKVYYEDEAIMSYAVSSDISKDDNSFAEEFNVSLLDGDNEYPVKVVWSGAYADVETGVKYTLNLDNIEVFYEEQSIVSLSARYTCDTSSVNATGPDSAIQVYDLTTTTVEDLENLIMDNQNKIINWVKDIVLETGEFGEMLDEYLFDGELSGLLQFF